MPAILLSLAGGCGSSVHVGTAGQSGGNGGEGGFIFLNGGGGSSPDAGKDGALPDVVDPGCPDQPPPIEDFQCDPYNQFNGDCASGEACYIFVDYPSEPCGQEIYGAYCFLEGSGGQGAPCNGGLDCQAGHVCVITGSGTQCVQLCNLFGNDGCPPGLLCEAIDVEGFGGCL
jgi:hypothetical protein